MNISMDLLKKLRDITLAPMKDCKEALVEAEGDLAKAQDILKQKGSLQAAKKSDRDTNEGVVKMKYENGSVIGLKMGCETDFVAKNDVFVQSVEKIFSLLSSVGKEISSLSDLDSTLLDQINAIITDCIATIRENVKILDVFVKNGTAFVYNHPGDKLSAAVFYENIGGDESVAKDVALQVASMNPDYCSIQDVPTEIVAKMKDEAKSELEGSNKPADVLEKIIEGKVMKAFAEIVLLEQLSIKDQTKKLKDIVNGKINVLSYKRMSI